MAGAFATSPVLQWKYIVKSKHIGQVPGSASIWHMKKRSLDSRHNWVNEIEKRRPLSQRSEAVSYEPKSFPRLDLPSMKPRQKRWLEMVKTYND